LETCLKGSRYYRNGELTKGPTRDKEPPAHGRLVYTPGTAAQDSVTRGLLPSAKHGS
jgi:hypothetical protein